MFFSVLDRNIFFQASTQNETTRTCEDERLVYLFNWLKEAKLSHSLLWLTFPFSCRGTSSNGGIHSKDNEQKRSGLSKVQNEACTPLPTSSTYKGEQRTKGATSKKHETARKIASMVKNPSTLKARSHLQLSQTKNVKPNSVKRLDFYVNFLYDIRLLMVRNVLIKRFYRETNVKDTSGTSSLAQENQAIKRQKLDGGLSRQVTVCCYIV